MGEGYVTVVAEMKAKAGKTEELKEVLKGLLDPTRKEEGCINYDMHQSADEPDKFLFYENWVDKATLDRHLATPHLKDFFSRIPELVDGEVKISLWNRTII